MPRGARLLPWFWDRRRLFDQLASRTRATGIQPEEVHVNRFWKSGFLKTAAVVVATAVITTLVVGAYSVTRAEDPVQISACVGKSGLMRILQSGGQCADTETLLTWNQQGPQGPAGPTGPTGLTGPTGATGPTGVVGFYDVEVNLGYVSPGGSVTFNVSCNAGDFASGGGYYLDRNLATAGVTQSRGEGMGWTVGFSNDASSSQSVGVRAYARCLDVTP